MEIKEDEDKTGDVIRSLKDIKEVTSSPFVIHPHRTRRFLSLLT